MRINKQKGGGLKMLYKRNIRKLTGNQAIHQLILNLHMMSCTGVRCADCPMVSSKQDEVCLIKQRHRPSIVYGLLEELGVSKEQVDEIVKNEVEKSSNFPKFMEQRKRLSKEELIEQDDYFIKGLTSCNEVNGRPTCENCIFYLSESSCFPSADTDEIKRGYILHWLIENRGVCKC